VSQAPKSPRKLQPKPDVGKVAEDTPRTSQDVVHPPTEKPVLKVETPEPNKYAPKEKIGTPTLGRSTNYVSTVGLGKLEVVHAEAAKYPYSEHKSDLT
tara:strand:+ start:2056 stop:2349 length:294 start_codon:yes stop_codon:yes gene_type:complete